MRQRIISACLGIPVILLLAWAGGDYWLVLSALAAIVGLYEFYRGVSLAGHKPLWPLGLMVLLWAFAFNQTRFTEALGVINLLLSVILLVFLHPRYHILDLAISWFGALYVGLFIGYIWKLSSLDHHFGAIVLTLILTWASDSGAYFVGTLRGKHKMVPHLSPNKTWEGFGGGFLATILTSIAGLWLMPDLHIWQCLTLGIAVGLVAPLGDLFASAVKRGLGLKDFGRIIPGHGGILDRLDSLMCVAPIVYGLTVFWGG